MFLRNFAPFLLAVFISHVFALNLTPITNAADMTGEDISLKREASFNGELDLRDFETFLWGSAAGTKLIYANLTVYFPEEYHYVIAMERFAGKLKSVQCADDMVLEFNDDAAFQYAKDTWNWVNDNVNNSFIMVTNYAGCADDMERLPFVVSNITYSEADNKAYLTADLKEWEEVMHSYTLHVGNMPLTPAHRALMARGLIPREGEFVMDLTSGYDQNLFSTTIGGWSTSGDATVRTVGTLNFDFDVDVGFLKLNSAALSVSPEDVAASVQLALTEEGTLSEAYNWQETIISIPIEGITILKVLKVGAFLDVDVGFTMDEWSGTAHANFGARMSLSNDAIVKVDLLNSDNNAFSGWTPTFSALPLTLDAKIEGSAEVFAAPNVKLEASALGKGWNVALGMKMPYISADFTAMANTQGVCDTRKTLGVDVDAQVGIDLRVTAATKGHEADPFWEQELLNKEWDLFSKCLAFGSNNAHTGEAVEPNPATKTKTKTKKKTKTSTTKKHTSTKKPSSTKATTTKTTAITKASSKTTSKASTKATTTGPIKTSSHKSSTKTSLHPTKATTTSALGSSSNSITSNIKPASTAEHSSSKIFSSETLSSSITEGISITSSSSLTTATFTNASRIHAHTADSSKPTGDDISSTVSVTGRSAKTSASSSIGSPTGSSTQIITSNNPSVSNSNSGSASFSGSISLASSKPTNATSHYTTKPPSTLQTLTVTSSSLSSTSTLNSCPISGCPTCSDDWSSDSDDDYFAIEASGGPPAWAYRNGTLHKRETRKYVYTCARIQKDVYMAEYPQLADWKKAGSSLSISEFYYAKNTDDCLNHQIAVTNTEPPASAGTGVMATEHIYEGNWILNFLRMLDNTNADASGDTNPNGLTCDMMHDLFFTESHQIPASNPASTWAQALMESLGSAANDDLLVFLRQNINKRKHLIFAESNIIADNTFKSASSLDKLKKMVVVGRALSYLSKPNIGERLKDTVANVDDTLNALLSAAQSNATLSSALGVYATGGLAEHHHSWLSSSLASRATFAEMQMKTWASEASKTLYTTTPVVTAAPDPTLSFLQSLQNKPITGFDAGRWL